MVRLTTSGEMRSWSREVRRRGERLGFVPTMGALHEGHLSLVEAARRQTDRVAVSVFVNPTQFGPGEDFERYPRDAERDADLLAGAGTDAVWFPETADLYPERATTWVVETDLSARLEGEYRPGHFRGVTTVVAKLLQVVEPDLMVMGQKDAQQAAVVGRMLRDLCSPVRLVVAPTRRESDGLALSSRNAYLSASERRQAVCLWEALQGARTAWLAGEQDPEEAVRLMVARIEAEPDTTLDYAAAVDPESYEPAGRLREGVLLLLAVRVGKTRLIDNLPLDGG